MQAYAKVKPSHIISNLHVYCNSERYGRISVQVQLYVGQSISYKVQVYILSKDKRLINDVQVNFEE